jgi:hypothetical protein
MTTTELFGEKALREDNARKHLVDYALDYFGESDWPAEVILAMCAIAFPKRTFRIDDDAADGLPTCDDAVDEDTGESAGKLWRGLPARWHPRGEV